MSEQVERRLLDLLDHPNESPYGNPIPALDELGDPPAGRFLDGVVSLTEAVRDGEATGVVRRLAEPVQFEPELLGQLRTAGVTPGATITAESIGSYVSVSAGDGDGGLELPNEVAAHIYVSV